MNRHALYHCGLDHKGNRHWRMKTSAAMGCHRKQVVLFPKVVVMMRCQSTRAVWRNGLHQRHWIAVAAQVRAHRRSFLTTLPRPPLVSPIRTSFD